MRAMEILNSLNVVLTNERNGQLMVGSGEKAPHPTGSTENVTTWKPGSAAPDPIPAANGESVTLPTWKPGSYAPDPIQARSI